MREHFADPLIDLDTDTNLRHPPLGLGFGVRDECYPDVRVPSQFPDQADNGELGGLSVLDRGEEKQERMRAGEVLPLDMELLRIEIERVLTEPRRMIPRRFQR